MKITYHATHDWAAITVTKGVFQAERPVNSPLNKPVARRGGTWIQRSLHPADCEQRLFGIKD